ncbi:hypothetical protein NXG27_09395 [Megasphaera paucivorans]|uniref:hypothetical protein n=1 Tax=Megasphaera paucivorans TaxID=349095 RepID=UPI003D085627
MEKISQKFSSVSTANILKILERACLNKKIVRISKGMYYKPRKTRFGVLPISESEIVDFFVGVNNQYGIQSGYYLFNKYNLTTQVAKKHIIYSNVSIRDKGKINNTVIIKLPLQYHLSMAETFEFIEILDQYQHIEDLNSQSFLQYCEYAVKKFNERQFYKICQFKKYKKKTVAFLKTILDSYHVPNDLGRYLNSTSRYNIPVVEGINETT